MLFELDKITPLPFEDMNVVHSEELLLANNIYDYLMNDAGVDHKKMSNMLEEFAYHLRDHFMFEEAMMKETNCPILSCHEAEHLRVLKIMYQIFKEYFDTKNLSLIQFYFEVEFKEWILHHIITMDTVTATFLSEPEKFQYTSGQCQH